ncbi:MAG: hypothetical protein JWO38_2211 [Gemmataceae bacterium]|nr:hypothetical protein [Gemmataceae bacterium]
MATPGFTAEASVSGPGQRGYAASGQRDQADRAVRPASCHGECVHDCLLDGHMSKTGCQALCRAECR